ncbi:factor arrest protein 7 [Monosporozyma unispora]|nr:hypothetical protein C6P44_000280 [Kazachstania unispora]
MQTNNGGRQILQQTNPVASQNQLYMSQQNENLEYLYSLIKQLMVQTKHNQQLKDNILESIDTLSNKLNRDPEKKSDNIKKDIFLFELFLSRNSLNSQNGAVNEDTQNESNDDLSNLKLQNERLHELLRIRKDISFYSVNTLKHHENGLSEVINLLRNDILQYQTSTLEQIRAEFTNILLAHEDSEFKQYLSSIEGIQKVFDIIKLYKTVGAGLEK